MHPAKPLFAASLLLLPLSTRAEKVMVAAAADLKFAMDEIVTAFKKDNPNRPRCRRQ
jgi:molybdate transport system substrate-binding protein